MEDTKRKLTELKLLDIFNLRSRPATAVILQVQYAVVWYRYLLFEITAPFVTAQNITVKPTVAVFVPYFLILPPPVLTDYI